MLPLTHVPQPAHCYQCYVTTPETITHREYPNVVFPPEDKPVYVVCPAPAKRLLRWMERDRAVSHRRRETRPRKAASLKILHLVYSYVNRRQTRGMGCTSSWDRSECPARHIANNTVKGSGRTSSMLSHLGLDGHITQKRRDKEYAQNFI
jgi:hypothetical protein